MIKQKKDPYPHTTPKIFYMKAMTEVENKVTLVFCTRETTTEESGKKFSLLKKFSDCVPVKSN